MESPLKNTVTVTMSGDKSAVLATIKGFFGEKILWEMVQDEISGRPETFVGIFTIYISDEDIQIELNESI
jgi:hypothetical protein